MSLLPVIRPPGITCPDWTAYEAGKKRCARYQPPAEGQTGGTCVLPAYFLCVEWAIANRESLPPGTTDKLLELARARGPASDGDHARRTPSPSGDPPPQAQAPNAPDAPRDLFGNPVEPSPAKAEPAPARPARSLPRPQTPYAPAKEIPQAEVLALNALGLELELSAEGLPEHVWLVPSRTTEPRTELTFREAATLRLLVDAFPGARIVGLSPAKPRAVDAKLEPILEVDLKLDGSACPACGGIQSRTRSGFVCEKGHGFGEPTRRPEQPFETSSSSDPDPFED